MRSGPEKDRCFFSLRDGDGPLGSGVPGDGLGALGHGVPSQLTRHQRLHSHLVLAARDGRALVVGHGRRPQPQYARRRRS